MGDDKDQKGDTTEGRLSGAIQKIIGEIEEVGGALTGDPTTVGEGEFNVDVGEIREEIEDTEAAERSDQ